MSFFTSTIQLRIELGKALSLETKSIPFCSGDWADDAAQQNHDAPSTVRGTTVAGCTVAFNCACATGYPRTKTTMSHFYAREHLLLTIAETCDICRIPRVPIKLTLALLTKRVRTVE